jgi:hypothetical protein
LAVEVKAPEEERASRCNGARVATPGADLYDLKALQRFDDARLVFVGAVAVAKAAVRPFPTTVHLVMLV